MAEYKTSLEVTPKVIGTYKRLSYSAWYALAEYIDNSTQAYFSNKENLDKAFDKERKMLRVDITYDNEKEEIIIEDNSYGMNLNDLKVALHVGDTTNSKGRSQYGLGMKTASCWFSDNWIVETKKYNSNKGYRCEVNVPKILASNTDELTITDFDASSEAHYTKITLNNLHRGLHSKTIWKIKDYLGKFYIKDILSGDLELYFNGHHIEYENIENELWINSKGEKFKKPFKFNLGKDLEKTAHGWSSVIFPGTRAKSGFSIYVNNRVIVCPPDAFKPDSIFGKQAGGSNTLVNQRLVGEIHLSGFDVSHQKDSIIWNDDEKEELSNLLKVSCQDTIDLANHLRNEPEKNKKIDIGSELVNCSNYVSEIVKSSDFHNALDNYFAFKGQEEKFEQQYSEEAKKTKAAKTPFFSAEVELHPTPLSVKFFANENSASEPYLFVDYSSNPNEILGVINALHPYFETFNNVEEISKFMEQCVFDSIAEWKSRKLHGALKPNVFRDIKDDFLRIPIKFSERE